MNPSTVAAEPATAALVDLLAGVAAEAASRIAPPRVRPLMSYAEAAEAMGVSTDTIRTLVERGVQVRPAWATTEVRTAVVTTVSVFEASGWPVAPVEIGAAV